ncbi:MAG: marine proteobacterial sortase target protein, partial [Pseudomonadota bacterium]
RAALQLGLDRLTPEDSFNIIEFNDQHSSLFSASHPASGDYLSAARRFVQQLDAGGGTEMEPALLQALRRPAVSPEHLKQVVFITDGAVGNEAALTRLVHQFLGDARLFSVGIGSAPNQHLFRQLSTLGKGTSVTIAEVGDVHDAMQRLFDKISAPAMRDIALVDAEGKLLEIEPNRIPDLYYGEPLNVLLRVSEPVGAVQLEGTLAGETLAVPLQLQQATPAAGVSTLWGRAKIRALNDKLYLGQGDPAALRQAIVDVSLKHRVLSEYTSYVAVDDQPVRRADQPLLETQVANILPQGMAFPTTALGTLPTFLVSLLSLLAAALIKAWRIFSVGTVRESDGLDRLPA